MENTQATAEVLNDLVQINNDRIKGYERALKELKDGETDLRTLFLSLIDASNRYKNELGKEVEVLGKDIDTGTSTGGKIHRAWLDVKAAFTAHDTHDILEECEFGEDAIVKAYRDALAEEYIPGFLRDLINRQHDEILDAHDEIKALRDSVH
ncbi:PA2169 family four-helix-bundle protein [Mucilaginibacter ginsenosidivorax]|uniref:PA2169 family four-helix-bundle protein n=1 Tax=Mucilaginibacter ginsenosidivorax TaxID=862126 RepID=A0A5B8W5R8_9SPHI|nr:PA2169 family four-helix-bundle protein [Mucilaginibacter ginsenosidivorax]QEC79143.1 PA2169 family four-helix-bundle protein [Mucilaginibacter ginsenosidivorax]